MVISANATLKRLAVGAAAGLAGGAVMRLCVSAWDRVHQHRPEFGAFGLDPEADRNAARQLWSLISDSELCDGTAEALGTGFHYALGVGAGMFYEFLPDTARVGFGTVYGTTVWLFGDLAAVSLSGVSDPRSKKFSSHAMALAAHLLFGATLESGRRLSRR